MVCGSDIAENGDQLTFGPAAPSVSRRSSASTSFYPGSQEHIYDARNRHVFLDFRGLCLAHIPVLSSCLEVGRSREPEVFSHNQNESEIIELISSTPDRHIEYRFQKANHYQGCRRKRKDRYAGAMSRSARHVFSAEDVELQ